MQCCSALSRYDFGFVYNEQIARSYNYFVNNSLDSVVCEVILALSSDIVFSGSELPCVWLVCYIQCSFVSLFLASLAHYYTRWRTLLMQALMLSCMHSLLISLRYWN